MESQHFVEYFYPGLLFAESSSRQIATHSVGEALKGMSKKAYGFKLYDKQILRAMVEDGTSTTVEKTLNESGMYYPGGVIYTMAEIKNQQGESILYCNMWGNDYKKVVKTRLGNYQPFTDKDRIL